jgi:hypothetical protein
MILRHQKASEENYLHDFYPKNFNHAFVPKPDFEGYRNSVKKEFEENQNYVGDEAIKSHTILVLL